ncbi:LOW QUALITY PROTEIN: hypothetical protein V1477_018785 [Vespula maculifrons]|uniref:Uncharacterized protein n=1 Tax=Vespula maculifrons TaxID=7453 RepID=A0ABD2AWC6_VESMC
MKILKKNNNKKIYIRKNKKKIKNYLQFVRERKMCPFYTVSNAFLFAIVHRHSLNNIYQKKKNKNKKKTKKKLKKAKRIHTIEKPSVRKISRLPEEGTRYRFFLPPIYVYTYSLYTHSI